MKLSRIEANWIASKIMSDAEQARERSAQRRTASLVVLFPALASIRPSERVSTLRSARERAMREPWIVWPTVVAFLLFLALYFKLSALQHPWMYWFPGTIVIGNVLAQYFRTRAILLNAAG